MIVPRPAYSSPFAQDSLETLIPIRPIDDITPEWAWGGSTGRAIKVAVIDSGVDAGHSAVGGRVSGYVSISEGPEGLVYDEEPHADVFGHRRTQKPESGKERYPESLDLPYELAGEEHFVMSLSNMMYQPLLWGYYARVRQLHEVSVAFVREIRGKAGTLQLLNLGSSAGRASGGSLTCSLGRKWKHGAGSSMPLWREAITVITSAAGQPRASGWTRRETL